MIILTGSGIDKDKKYFLF